MKQVITDDWAMVEQMKAMLNHFDLDLNVEKLSDGRFKLTMSEDAAAQLRPLLDSKVDNAPNN